MKKGLLITVEGTDGAGKSTQIDFINKYFKKEGRQPIFIRTRQHCDRRKNKGYTIG